MYIWKSNFNVRRVTLTLSRSSSQINASVSVPVNGRWPNSNCPRSELHRVNLTKARRTIQRINMLKKLTILWNINYTKCEPKVVKKINNKTNSSKTPLWNKWQSKINPPTDTLTAADHRRKTDGKLLPKSTICDLQRQNIQQGSLKWMR